MAGSRAGWDAATVRTLGGWALAAGGILFAVFWGMSALWFEPPWLPSLAMHAVTIGLLAFGLISRVVGRPLDAAHRVELVGVVISILGLVTVFPLIPAGLLFVGAVAWARGRRFGGAALSLGAAALLVAYAAGARYGTEGVVDPGDAVRTIFLLGAVLTAIGLVQLGGLEARQQRLGTFG